MKNKIICLVLSLAFVLGVWGANGTYAWFVVDLANGQSLVHNFTAGDISYTLTGDFVESGKIGLIKPEQELLQSELTLINASTIPTNLRVKVFYTYFVPAEDPSLVPEGIEIVNGYAVIHDCATVGEGAPLTIEYDQEHWEIASDDCFYYTNGTDSVIPAAEQGGENLSIPLFSKLYYSGANTVLPTSAFAGDNNEFNIKIVFQAKQANFAEWTDIGTITLDTGAAEEASTQENV